MGVYPIVQYHCRLLITLYVDSDDVTGVSSTVEIAIIANAVITSILTWICGVGCGFGIYRRKIKGKRIQNSIEQPTTQVSSNLNKEVIAGQYLHCLALFPGLPLYPTYYNAEI